MLCSKILCGEANMKIAEAYLGVKHYIPFSPPTSISHIVQVRVSAFGTL